MDEIKRLVNTAEDQRSESPLVTSIQNGGCGLILPDLWGISNTVRKFIKSEQRL
jgi:hypothetical protein